MRHTKQKTTAASVVPASAAPERLLVDIPTAAKMLSTTTWQVRSLHWSRRLRFVKLGKKFVVSVEKVRAFAASIGDAE